MKSLTIIIPVYNEESCLHKLFSLLEEYVKKSSLETTVLMIDDGSTDGSLSLIEKFCLNNKNFCFLSLSRNSGLSAALKCGIDYAESDLIGYMDADLQTSPEDFNSLLQFIPEYDMVMGYRINRKDGFVKKISSLIANKVRKFILKDDIVDIGCPLKIIKSEYAKNLILFHGMHRFLPNAVIMMGGRVKQIPVRHYPRIAGKSKYNLLNRLIGPFVTALIFRWMQKNYIRYQIKSKKLCPK
ncbi:MAG: glycosyltransferase family 2 protein [Cyclobacteriaceae bacterium]|nr:glycosyltransferase family 2 protein [Cyclobacteriaceae bacterium]